MSKGVGWYVIFIILVIAMFIAAMLVVFWHYINAQNIQATREACAIKLQNYCYRWVTEKREPGDWDKVYPQGCEQFGITKPDESYCKNLFGITPE
jgi:cell division protein FtsL